MSMGVVKLLRALVIVKMTNIRIGWNQIAPKPVDIVPVSKLHLWTLYKNVKQCMPITHVIYHSLFLSGLYSETANKYCRTNGRNEISLDGDYSQLDTAQASCMGDDTCFGVYDLCGDGKTFQLCNASMSIGQSGCGSILYKRKGKLFIYFRLLVLEYIIFMYSLWGSLIFLSLTRDKIWSLRISSARLLQHRKTLSCWCSWVPRCRIGIRKCLSFWRLMASLS